MIRMLLATAAIALLPGLASAQTACSHRGALDDAYCDENRDLVADVCVASLTDPKASKKVLEIIEDDGKPPEVFNGLKM